VPFPRYDAKAKELSPPPPVAVHRVWAAPHQTTGSPLPYGRSAAPRRREVLRGSLDRGREPRGSPARPRAQERAAQEPRSPRFPDHPLNLATPRAGAEPAKCPQPAVPAQRALRRGRGAASISPRLLARMFRVDPYRSCGDHLSWSASWSAAKAHINKAMVRLFPIIYRTGPRHARKRQAAAKPQLSRGCCRRLKLKHDLHALFQGTSASPAAAKGAPDASSTRVSGCTER
jgi:hypothetical protein